jgi:DNA-binding Xre family transcriptional regulator
MLDHDAVRPTKLRVIRLARGLTQVKLSVKARLALATVRLADVHGILTTRTAARLSRALECQVADLLPPRGDDEE